MKHKKQLKTNWYPIEKFTSVKFLYTGAGAFRFEKKKNMYKSEQQKKLNQLSLDQ